MRPILLFISLLTCLAGLFSPALASAADTKAMAQDPIWLKLGHYHYDTLGYGSLTSYVADDAFFLSPEGKHDPEAELKATLKLFKENSSAKNGKACRYPARHLWLTEQGVVLPELNCPDYQSWQQRLDASSITLAFPAAYMNSPSSMFGHTFLRFDPADIANDSLWLSWAINFGATTEPGDNSVLYAWKGIAGGYPGYFAMLPYYRKLQEYNRLENRDIWEYQLNLTAAQTRFISAHIWELKEIRFNYYFFDENCSFRLLELLELASPQLNLTERFELAAIPVDTVRAVIDAGLVQQVQFRPSNASVLQANLTLLNDEEQELAYRLATETALLKSEEYRKLSEDKQSIIVQSAYKYLRYEVNDQERKQDIARTSLRLLRELNQLPPQAPVVVPRPVQPEQGHDTARLSVNGGYQRRDGEYIELQGRLTYHDLLDNQPGFPQGAEITMGDIRLRAFSSGELRLEQVDIINIRSLAPRTRFFTPLAWQVNTGLERQPGGSERDNLVAQIHGGAGFSWELKRDLAFFSLATARLENNPGFARNLQFAPGVNSGLAGSNSIGNWLLELQLDQFLNGQIRSTLGFGQQWEINRNNGLRLGVQYKNHEELSDYQYQLSWHHYF